MGIQYLEDAEISLQLKMIEQMLEEIKALPEPWQKLSENKQRDVIDRVKNKSENLVRSAVHQIARKGFESCHCNVESVQFKDGVKIALKSSNSQGAHMLADNTSGEVLVVLAPLQDYLGGDMPKPDPDQHELAMVEEN